MSTQQQDQGPDQQDQDPTTYDVKAVEAKWQQVWDDLPDEPLQSW